MTQILINLQHSTQLASSAYNNIPIAAGVVALTVIYGANNAQLYWEVII